MKKTKKHIHILAFLSAMLLFFPSCGPSNTADDTPDVRIAYFPNIIHTQALVMKNQGTPEQTWGEKCNVIWTSFNAGPAEIEAIFAGEIDLGYIGPVPAINANIKSGGDVKIISNAADAGAVFLVRKESGIASVKDLAGKKIAVPQLGNTQHLCLLSLLKEYDLKTVDQGGDATINASSNADIVNLMDNGSIDAAVVPEPWGTTIENNENADILLDYDELFFGGDYPTALVIANEDFMEKHPDLVSEFLEMHKEATEFINDNPNEVLEIVNTEIENATGKSLEEDVIAHAFSRIKITDELNTDAIMRFAKISKEEGFTSKIPEEEDVFNFEFSQ